MRKRKAGVFAELTQDYQRHKTEWGGFAGYDRFFVEPNNAKLASVALYNTLVPRSARTSARHVWVSRRWNAEGGARGQRHTD